VAMAVGQSSRPTTTPCLLRRSWGSFC
jgi:hypothetical protein